MAGCTLSCTRPCRCSLTPQPVDAIAAMQAKGAVGSCTPELVYQFRPGDFDATGSGGAFATLIRYTDADGSPLPGHEREDRLDGPGHRRAAGRTRCTADHWWQSRLRRRDRRRGAAAIPPRPVSPDPAPTTSDSCAALRCTPTASPQGGRAARRCAGPSCTSRVGRSAPSRRPTSRCWTASIADSLQRYPRDARALRNRVCNVRRNAGGRLLFRNELRQPLR